MRINLRPNLRIVALLLLVLQLGLIAHRIEHYVLPDHVESGEDECAAFAPVTDPPALPVAVTPPTRIAYFVRFWTARDTIIERPSDRLGFRAHAPPA
jgi:hypothetical protein